MKLTKVLFIFLWLLTISRIGFAAGSDPAPVAMLKSVSSQMLGELNKDLGKLKGNDKLVDSLVNRILVPHFDLVSMSAK